MIRNFVNDALRTLRSMRGQPSFFAAIVGIIALTVGTNGLIFGLVRGVLLRPLPYSQPEDLVAIWEENPQQAYLHNTVSLPNFMDWRRTVASFTAMAAWKHQEGVLTGQGEPERLVGAMVTSDFLDVLRVKPLMGRMFRRDEEGKGKAGVVLISEGLWRRRFGASREIIGHSIPLDGNPFTVIGILPDGFDRPLASLLSKRSDFWRPMAVDPPRGTRFLVVLGRTSRSLSSAKEELGGIAHQLSDQYPKEDKGWTVSVVPLDKEIVYTVRPVLQILMAAAILVLLVGCINLANVLLARAAGREHEVALRLSFGATRRQLFSLFAAESLMLVLPGSLLGSAFAMVVGRSLTREYLQFLPRVDEIDMGRPVLWFTLFLAVVITLAAAVLVEAQISKLELGKRLPEMNRRAGAGRETRRTRDLLAILQVVFTFPLLVSTILLMKSMQRLERVDLGFNPQNAVAGEVILPASRYKDPQAQSGFYRSLLEKLRGTAGIVACSAVSDLPLSEWDTGMEFAPVGLQLGEREKKPFAQFRIVTPDYFLTMGIRRSLGRDFDYRDRIDAEPVLVVNDELARRFFAGRDPVGERLLINRADRLLEGRIVGVVGNLRHKGPADDIRPTIYVSYLQFPSSRMTILLRSPAGPEVMASTLGHEIRALDSSLPPPDLVSMEHLYNDAIAGPRLRAIVLGVFGGLALALAALGIYAVVSYSTATRRHEIGVRMALGAKRPEILAMILRYGTALCFWGIVGGSLLEAGATRLLAGHLYGVGAMDVGIWIAVAGLMVLVGIIASLKPASSAIRLAPALVLKTE